MGKLFESVNSFDGNESLIKARPYGVIECREGNLVTIRFKPWPKIISATEAAWLGAFKHKRVDQDRCRIFYNQPIGHRSFLALKYIESTLGTTLATLRRTMQVLDEIARVKKTDAILAHVTNKRISDRLLRRWGWETHLNHKRSRHFIKRFYGEYPPSIFESTSAATTDLYPEMVDC